MTAQSDSRDPQPDLLTRGLHMLLNDPDDLIAFSPSLSDDVGAEVPDVAEGRCGFIGSGCDLRR
jgi:hypothetical protein